MHINTLLTQANTSYEAGNFQQARVLYEQLLQYDSKNNLLSIRFYLGVCYLELNLLDDAENFFLHIININNEHIQTLINLGVIALKREHSQDAIDYFTAALKLDNKNIYARNNLAATFMHYDRFENALIHYLILLQDDENNIEYLYNAGVAQMVLGSLTDATNNFLKVLTLHPQHFATLHNLAALNMRLGNKNQAINLFEQALLIQPDNTVCKFMLQALVGNIIEPCHEYVQNLFNNYALYYDKHLQNTLHYQLPIHLQQLIAYFNINNLQYTLDLGCGTGLCGIYLRKISTQLIGVDIAQKMLAQAERKAIYDQLICTEIIEFLLNTENKYDLINLMDVIPYFGAINELIELIGKKLSKHGFCILSHEINHDDKWKLQNNARFSHNAIYINEILYVNNLKIIQQKQVIARTQESDNVVVMLYTLQFTDI